MLNNKKNIYIQLMFRFVKTVQNIQKDQKAKLDYRMSKLFAYMAGGEGVGVRGFKMFCQRGVRIFSTCFVCLCVCVWGGGGGQAQYLSFREKNS